jgi:Ca2+/Na+ antiporter
MGQLNDGTSNFSCQDIGMVGPLNVDYVHIYNCELKGFEAISILLLIFWTFILIDILAKVESGYFTPTLASISLKWHLSDNFAGVTLLAFANGAPDVFCSLIGLMSTGNTDLGISALLGGALFVSSVVVGCIAIFCPCKLNGILFTRDSIFLIIAVVRLAILSPDKEVTLQSAVSLLVIYVIYLLVVLITPWIENHYSIDRSAETDLCAPNIQTAVWNHDGENDEVVGSSDRSKSLHIPSTEFGVTPEDSVGGYKFIILDDYVAVKDLEGDASVGLGTVTENNETTINLSASKTFTGKIIEEFHRATELSDNDVVGELGKADPNKSSLLKKICASSDTDKLRESLLPEVDDEDLITLEAARPVKSNNISTLPSKYATIMALSVRHRFMKRNAKDWDNFSWPRRLLLLIEYPFMIAMDLTIATLDEELWDKKNAVLQPLIVPFFLTSLTGGFRYIFSIPYAIVHVIFFVPVSLLIFFYAHSSYPPRHAFFSYCWLSFGFLSCVMWTYLLSGELVTALLSTGAILHIPSYYLGLTVLAWGNSIGDLFSNISIAKKGMGEMAIGGCYAGPLFNILTGMGISLTYICYHSYPLPSKFLLDTSACVSIGFLLIAVFGTVFYTALQRFRLSAVTGYALIMLYTLYTIIQTFIAAK